MTFRLERFELITRKGNVKNLKQYTGQLSVAQIAAGMNHCQDNAARLLQAARTLYKLKDYATSVSLAVLAIEEAGKLPILRRMLTAIDEGEVRQCWKEFRSHCLKNGQAKFLACVKSTVRLDDLRCTVEKTDENQKLDDLKQAGFYVDCVGNAGWMSPVETITDEIAAAMVLIASIVCSSGKPTQVRELELWKETVGTCPHGTLVEMKNQVVQWHRRMEEEGLSQPDPGFEKFVMEGVEVSDMAGCKVAECMMSVMSDELSIDSVWKKVIMQMAKGARGRE